MPGAPYERLDGFGGASPMRAAAFEQITVAGTAVGFTAATIAPSGATNTPATMATVTVETAPVRYRTDGTAPTASVGTLLNIGDRITVWGQGDVAAIQFIRTTGTSATIDCEYSR